MDSEEPDDPNSQIDMIEAANTITTQEKSLGETRDNTFAPIPVTDPREEKIAQMKLQMHNKKLEKDLPGQMYEGEDMVRIQPSSQTNPWDFIGRR